VDSRLIEKFFRGGCSQKEVAEILDWFEKEDFNLNQEQDLYRFWQETADIKQHKEFTRDAARILAGINKAIDSQEKEPERSPASGKVAHGPALKPGHRAWIAKAVAAVFLLTCFLWLFTCHFSAEERGAPRVITQEALPGTRKTISLEDGSKITLNAGSKISYQEPFSAYNREITLRGEAFFEVAQDSLRPFIVRTGHLTTQALGTSFNIKYRVAAKEIAVALATGSVKIAQQAKAGSFQIARLAPGQQLVYNQADKGYRVTAFDPMAVLAWREGILYFKKANLNQVVETLESWYGVEIELVGKVTGKEKERLYTGAYDNQSLADVLEGISFVKGFTYEKKGNRMVLRFN
jgi:transmembrane sensor